MRVFREVVLSVSDHISNVKLGEKKRNVREKTQQQSMPDMMIYVKVFEHISTATNLTTFLFVAVLLHICNEELKKSGREVPKKTSFVAISRHLDKTGYGAMHTLQNRSYIYWQFLHTRFEFIVCVWLHCITKMEEMFYAERYRLRKYCVPL